MLLQPTVAKITATIALMSQAAIIQFNLNSIITIQFSSRNIKNMNLSIYLSPHAKLEELPSTALTLL
jgi:hypothetical protein